MKHKLFVSCLVLLSGFLGMTLSAMPLPVTMQIAVNPTSIAPGDMATVTATVTPNTGTINCGKGHIQYRIYVPDGMGGFLLSVDWTDLANNIDVVNNQFSAVFDSMVIPVNDGDKVSFRAGYASSGMGCNFQNAAIGQSPTVDLLIVEAGPCPEDQTTGVYITIEGPDGNGMPAPGNSGPWSFTVKVTACEDVYDVTAQGGANGWAPIKSASASAGTSVTERKVNNKNTVYLWTIGDMTAGQDEELTVTVDATIKSSMNECGKVKILNGNWSALFATVDGGPLTKSDYTDYQATIQVTCN